MSVSPFTFLRGSAILQAHDFAGTVNSGISFPICGDAHLMNFGGFATPERQLVFDFNDFDEAATGHLGVGSEAARRQLRDMKVSAEVERMSNTVLQGYARVCGWALARAHAKASGKAVEIAAYLGSGERMAEALTEYAFAYAAQNESDYMAFMSACRSGRLEACSDEDMATDFRV